MKLYAKATSERAGKGQGGNKYLEIEIKAFDRVKPIGVILLTVEDDSTGKPNQYLLKWQDIDWRESGDWQILREGHAIEGVIQHSENPPATKGKQQKDAIHESDVIRNEDGDEVEQ